MKPARTMQERYLAPVMSRCAGLALCLLLGATGIRALHADGRLLPARAQTSRDDANAARPFRPSAVPGNGTIRLAWTVPAALRAARIRLFSTRAPRAKSSQPLVTLAGDVRGYEDHVPNWSPRYYRLEAVDARGRTLLTSDLAAAVARPAGRAAAPVETFAFWYEPYRPTTGPDPSLRHIGNAAFVVGPGMEAAADLVRAGKGLLPYVTFYQTANWAGRFSSDADPQKVAAAIAPIAFYRADVHFPGSPAGYVPTVFCRPGNVEYNPRSIQYTTCPNSTPFRELVLAHVRRQLEGGARGFFVDNGFDDDVAARAVCESTRHAHYYGDHLTAADAFLGVLLEVSCEVKKRYPNGMVMVNGGVPKAASFYGLTLGDVCDGQLWESYLRSSYSTPREHVADWQQVYRRSVDLEKAWHGTPPRRVFVLSYPWDRSEAFFCYCTARLCHLPWSACLGVSDPKHLHFGGHFGTYPELIDLRLGEPAHEREYGGRKQGVIYYREYERGMVVVNPTRTEQTATLALGRMRRYQDLFVAQDDESASLTLRLPAESGRVFVWRGGPAQKARVRQREPMTRATSFLLANGSAGGARSPANRPGPQPGFARLTVRARGGPVTVTLPRRDYRFRPAGKTYYLAPDGADGADGSKAHPWRSFDRALPALKPGDLLYARGGSYPTPFTIRSSGLPGRPLIISAYPGEQARITQPPGWQREHVHSATVTFQQAKYVWLQGFTIEGCLGTPQAPPGDTYGQNGITLSGSAGEGVRILNNFVSRAQHCGIKEMGHGGRRFVIEGNVVFDNGRTERDHGLYIPSDEAILRGNAVFRNSGFGIHLYHAPRHCQVYDNLCFENGAAGIIVAGSDNLIAHNVCTRNRACGLLLFRGGCTGNVIVDSLLFDNRQGQIAMDNGGGQLGTPTGNRVDFNLLFPPQDAVALPSFAASVGPHGVRADPQVLDAAANDFRLRPTSPARRAAQPLRQIHTAGSPDIGLFPATQYPSPRWTWAGPARRGWLSELPAGTTSR